ncbi:MAG: hypothetical protein AABX39_03660 [Nanoarchaeota archaeon]
MTIEEKINEETKQGTTYPLKAEHLVAFAVLADLKSAQKSYEINIWKINGLALYAEKMKFGLFNRTPVFDVSDFSLKYLPWCYVSEDTENYVPNLTDLKLPVNPSDPGVLIAGPKCLDEFKRIVNNLYQERPDIAKAYTKLVGSSPEKFFDSEGKGHYV